MRPSFHQMLKLSILLLLSLFWACVSEDPKIIDNKLLSPTSISLESPTNPPFTLRNPTFKVDGVSANQTVKLFSDSKCQNIVGTKISSSTSVSITTDDLSFGTNTIYASISDANGKSSLCSSSFATYALVSFPKITGIQDLNVSINEEELKTISFTAIDEDNSSFGCSSVGVTSSNLSLFPSVSISGTGTNCILTLKPRKDQSGEGTITLVAKEGLYGDSKELKLTVNPLPDPPSIVLSKLALTFLEDRPSEQIILTISDPDPDAIMNCNQISFIPSSIVDVLISGSAPGCVATITPKLDQSGPTSVLFTVSNGLTDSEYLDITIIPDPDRPEITLSKNSLTMIEDQTSSETFNVKVFDPDSEISCSNLSLSSSTLVSSASGGVAPNCTLTLTPKLNQNGTENLIVTFKNDLEVTAPFSLTVTPVDDAPKIELSTNSISFKEDDEAKPLVVTVSDVDNENINCSQVSVSGSIDLFDPILIPSTSSPCNFSLKPKLDLYGSGELTFKVDNGKSDSKKLNFSIAEEPDVPLISLQSSSLSFKEDSAEQFVKVSISDKDSEINCTKLSVASSKDLVILGTPTSLPGGTTNSTDCSVSVKPKPDTDGDGDLTFTVDTGLEAAAEMSFSITPEEDAPTIEIVTPAFSFKEDESGKLVSLKIDDKDSPVSCSNVSVSPNSLLIIGAITGTDKNCSLILTPKKDDFGEVDLTFTVNNGLEGRVTRNIKVEAVNDDPVILINNNTLSFEEDGALQRIELTLSDIDSEVSCSQVSASLSDLVTSALLTTTGKICGVNITPKENQNGSGEVVFTVNNGLVANTKLSISISSFDDAPEIKLPLSLLSFQEDGALQTIQLSLSDVDTEVNCSQLSVSSPEHVTALRVSNSGKLCDVTVKPVLDKYGTGDIIFTVTNTKTVTQKLAYTIINVDDVPVISLDKPSLSFSEDGAAQTVQISISDKDSAVSCPQVSVGENSLVSLGAVNVSGSGCSATVTPIQNKSGSSTLTFKVTNTLSSEALLNFTILPEDDAPVAAPVVGTLIEDTLGFVTLFYTDVEGNKASECTLSDLKNLTFNNCLCDAVGECKASVTGTLNFNGAASFSYTVKANGKPSNPSTAAVTIAPQDDAPVAKTIYINMAEDIESQAINLEYTDVENDEALSCTTSYPVKLTFTSLCSCSQRLCTVKVKGLPDYSGDASFKFNVTAKGNVSNTASVLALIQPSNDAPILSNTIQNIEINKGDTKSFNLETGYDPEGSVVSYVIVTQPTLGTLTCSGGTSSACSYTQNKDLAGATTDSFTVISHFLLDRNTQFLSQ